MKLKAALVWFPAPMQWNTAIEALSDGAFKLFVYLCLNADRETAQFEFKQTVLARTLGKSRRSLARYLRELQDRQICTVNMSSNQYSEGMIRIQQTYWPYEGTPSAVVQDQDSYLHAIKSYLHPRVCVRCRFSNLDRQLAQKWFQAGVKLRTIEQAIILVCSRKYISWLNGGESPPIGSLRYFEQAIKEVLKDTSSPEYWDFTKAQLKRIEQQWVLSHNVACENFSQPKEETR